MSACMHACMPYPDSFLYRGNTYECIELPVNGNIVSSSVRDFDS